MDKIPGRVISFLSAILIAVSSASCVEELVVDRNFDVEEGLPVQMTLDFLSQQNRVETRAAQDETYENRVNNLYVFIFNQAGEVHYKKFFGTTDILPLTGVTLPFVSHGGSSMISSFALLAFIKSADERTYALKRN